MPAVLQVYAIQLIVLMQEALENLLDVLLFESILYFCKVITMLTSQARSKVDDLGIMLKMVLVTFRILLVDLS